MATTVIFSTKLAGTLSVVTTISVGARKRTLTHRRVGVFDVPGTTTIARNLALGSGVETIELATMVVGR